jgi:hypothetical protein
MRKLEEGFGGIFDDLENNGFFTFQTFKFSETVTFKVPTFATF